MPRSPPVAGALARIFRSTKIVFFMTSVTCISWQHKLCISRICAVVLSNHHYLYYLLPFFSHFFYTCFFFIFRVVLRCRNRKNTDVIFCGDEKCTGTSIWNVVDCSGILQVMDMVFIWMNNSSSLFFIFVVVVLLENALTKKYYCMEPRWKKRLLPVITVTFLFYYYNNVEEGKHWMCGNCLLQVAKCLE